MVNILTIYPGSHRNRSMELTTEREEAKLTSRRYKTITESIDRTRSSGNI